VNVAAAIGQMANDVDTIEQVRYCTYPAY